MATGRTFHRPYFLFFVENFGVVGAFNVPIEPFDLHNTYVFVGIVGLVVGVAGLRVATHRNRVLYMAILFDATWLLLALPYYSGRSLIETLVSAYTLPAGLLITLLLVAVYPRLRWLRRAGVRGLRFGGWITVLTSFVGLAFVLATWTGFPYLPEQAARVQKQLALDGDFEFTRPDPTGAIERLPADTSLIGLFGVSSGIWSIKLGVTNADVFLHPDYLTFTGGPATACLYAARLPGESLLMTKAFLPYMEEDKVCQSEFDFESVTDVYSQNSDSPDPGDWILLPRR